MEENVHKCECGCGVETRRSPCAYHARGIAKGDYNRFLPGHSAKGKFGKLATRWNGGTTISHGYVRILKPEHPRADCKGYVYDHILIVEAILGRFLPKKNEVHHFNERKGDNGKGNIVVCEDAAYHKLLHLRMRALKACGDARQRRCTFCREYDSPENLTISKSGTVYHNKCRSKSRREKYQIERRIIYVS